MTETKCGMFGHHPDPAIDFCVEVEEIEAIWIDRCNKFANPDDPSLESRVRRAMMFKVGGDIHAINAKDRVRKIDADLGEEEITRIVRMQAAASDLYVSLKRAVEIIKTHVPKDALGTNAQGDPDVPGGYQEWPLLDEYLHHMSAALAKAEGNTGTPHEGAK